MNQAIAVNTDRNRQAYLLHNQIIITELYFKRYEVKKLRKAVDAYEFENQKLKILLGEKTLREMVGEDE